MSFKLQSPVPADRLMMSNRDLTRLILPLVFEQFLMMFVGVVDTAMVSRVGEAAVSGVSLVDMVNQLMIQILAALTTGGAVIASQYIGHKEEKRACEAANQLIVLILLIGLGIMAVFIILKQPILRLFFGSIDDDVMSEALIYIFFSALSYPFLGLYSAGAALFRSMKKTHITLLMSALMNVINVIFNAVFIFGMDLGVAGAALGSFVGRCVAAVTICGLLINKKHLVHFTKPQHPIFNGRMMKKILYIGIPNGLENGMFQLGRILVVSIISGFGTVQIAANAVANNIDGIGVIPGFAVGIGMITVVGQCVGARDYEQAAYYTKKMNRIAGIIMLAFNGGILLLLKQILGVYVLSEETLKLAMILIGIHCVCAMFIWTPSFVMPNALRASNDVKYTMTVSIASMWVFRIFFSVILGKWMGMGAIGVWIAMILDWICRGILFRVRFARGKWKRIQLI